MKISLNERGTRNEELIKIFGGESGKLRVAAYLVTEKNDNVFIVQDSRDVLPRMISEADSRIVDDRIPADWLFGSSASILGVLRIIGYKDLVNGGEEELLDIFNYEPEAVFRFKSYIEDTTANRADN